MILRVFRASVREGNQAEFMRLVEEQSIPGLLKQEGLLRHFPGAPMSVDGGQFTMVTVWRDIDSLKSFAGHEWERPDVTPDEAPLVESMSAEHYVLFG